MKIIGHILRELRERANLTREELAERSKVSQKQISRLEAQEVSEKVRELTVKRLEVALRTSRSVLDGTEQMPKPKIEPGNVTLSSVISHSSRLSLELLSLRYGVSASEVFNLAPLMFALLAEGSLAWRRGKLAELEEASERLVSLADTSHLAFVHAGYRVSNAAEGERTSIKRCDLFGEQLDDDAYNFGYDPRSGSPFAHYLAMLAKTHDPSVVDIDEVGGEHDGRYPSYSLCDAELERVAGPSKWGRIALRFGHARLGDIPAELLVDGREADRAAWLDSKMPPELAASWDAMGEIEI